MINLTHEEAQQVLYGLDDYWITTDEGKKLIETLRAKLSEPESEPVAWMEIQNYLDEENLWCERKVLSEYDNGRNIPLYTAPPQREWVGLTDEDLEQVMDNEGTNGRLAIEFARAIEAKLKEKNT